MSKFTALQEEFVRNQFNTLMISQAGGQVLQPAAALPTDDDSAVWRYFDAIPLDSPIYEQGSSQFFSSYRQMIDSLVAGSGPADPIKNAKEQLDKWGNRAPSWNGGYARLVEAIQRGTSVTFNFSSQPANSDSDPGFWGLWRGDDVESPISTQFASETVSASFHIDKFAAFQTNPASWFSAIALVDAYSNQDGLPWNPSSPVDWQSTFGDGGMMPRFLTTLYVGEEINVRYQSTAQFDSEQKQSIQSNAARGMWPYYMPASTATTDISFQSNGAMTVSISSLANTAILIAAMVVPAAQFAGR